MLCLNLNQMVLLQEGELTQMTIIGLFVYFGKFNLALKYGRLMSKAEKNLHII